MWPAKSTERLPPQSPLDKHESVQGAQFTSRDWTDKLKAPGIQISMDGKGRCLDNVFIEQLWRSLNQECVYLNAFDSVHDCQAGIGAWMDDYNRERTHSSLGDLNPSEAYEILFENLRTNFNGSINQHQRGYTLIPLPSCSNNGGLLCPPSKPPKSCRLPPDVTS